jgi:hypothetical protein
MGLPFMSFLLRMRRHGRQTLGDDRGAAMVEFALVLPILLLIVFGMIDIGKAVAYWNDTTHLASEASRQAVVNHCPAGAAGPLCLSNWIKVQAESAELRNGGGSIGGTGMKVTICFPNGTQNVGDPVEVDIDAQYNWLSFLGGIAPIRLTGKSTQRIETAPDGTVYTQNAIYDAANKRCTAPSLP